MNFFLLQSLILLLLSFVIGYMIGRFVKRKLCNRAARKAQDAISRNEANTETTVTARPEAKARAAHTGHDAMFAAGIQPDNLQIIEGIGPKMESVLNDNGIETWAQLAAVSSPDMQGLLDKYGNRYQIIDPTIWLEQAKLAAAGEIDALIKLQKIDGVSKLENMMNADNKNGFGGYQQDDLKIVEGIGPKIEMLLKNSGISTWQSLSKTEPSSIKAILNAAGPKYRLAIPESWPLQANLASNGEWGKLKQLKDGYVDARSTRGGLASAEAVS